MNNKKIKFVLISFGIVLIIAFVIYAITVSANLIKNPTDTFIIEKSKLSLEEKTEGYIIREETLIHSENDSGEIVKIKDEGQKIAKGDAVFRYKNSNEDELTKKIEELDKKIEETIENDKETSLFQGDVAILENQIEKKLEETYMQNDIQKLSRLKSDINGAINKKAKIAGELSPAGSYIKELINERSSYENELNSNSQYITAEKSGIVSYSIDGYEEMLSIENKDNITKETLEKVQSKTGQATAESEKSAKIINNYEAYLVTILASDSSKKAIIGDKVKIQLASSEEILATIEQIKEINENERIIFFKIKNGIEATTNYRKIALDIIWWSSEGLKVPNSAIITEENKNYVIRNRAGYTDKILIKVLRQNENYSLIDNYSTQELKDIGLSSNEIVSLKRISMYDEIIIGK